MMLCRESRFTEKVPSTNGASSGGAVGRSSIAMSSGVYGGCASRQSQPRRRRRHDDVTGCRGPQSGWSRAQNRIIAPLFLVGLQTLEMNSGADWRVGAGNTTW
jgi:hypothetical protein